MASRQASSDDDNEEQETDDIAEDEVITIPKKRKEVTTSSILENFLLLATSLDDTVREESVVRSLGNTFERSTSSGSKTGTSKGKKSRVKDGSLSTPPQARLLTNQLNLQRQSIRKAIRSSIIDFSASYDSQSVLLGELNTSQFEYELDEQGNLSKERWSIDLAIERLREVQGEMKLDCVDLGRGIRVKERTLNGIVDDIIEQRK